MRRRRARRAGAEELARTLADAAVIEAALLLRNLPATLLRRLAASERVVADLAVREHNARGRAADGIRLCPPPTPPSALAAP